MLRLYEYQAKRIFRENGIKLPRGIVAHSSYEVFDIVKDFDTPVIIKAQVLVGGRGLAGGIKSVQDKYEARKIADQLIGGSLKNEDIAFVLVEEKISIEKEYYAGVTIDYNSQKIVVIASSRGGVDIETISKDHPNEVTREEINSNLGLTDYQSRLIAKKVGLSGSKMFSFATLLKSLYSILLKYDATLVEVNPLALTPKGSFIALDAKLTLDDNASFRHGNLFESLKLENQSYQISLENSKLRKDYAEKAGIPTYIELNGNIGIISDGAGTGMLTLDLMKEKGGEVETYCELGGKATPSLIEETMNIISLNEDVRVILINLIGGLNRMDEMAEGIKAYKSTRGKPEIIVRMSGTLEEEGRKILGDLGVESFDNIYDAIDKSIEIVGRN